MDIIFGRIETLLRSCGTNVPFVSPTVLYNEGWMLRLLMTWFASCDASHPLAVPRDCRWYSEALLPSAFLQEFKGDSRAESWTHADGVIGQFDIGNGAKGNLTLLRDAHYFVVLEAKMFSRFSAGVNNASYYNQAARTVACMAEVLKRAGRQAADFTLLGFYVLAPASQIKKGLFDKHLTKDSIRRVVERRVADYGGKRDKWFSEWFLPTHARLDIKSISWEDLISFLAERDSGAEQLDAFYKRCLEFNKPPEGVI